MWQNVWHFMWKTHDMLHDKKCVTCVMCYITQNEWHVTCHKDLLHDAKYVTYYMTQNVWHVTWYKMYDMLHEAKCVTYCMKQNVWHRVKFAKRISLVNGYFTCLING